MILLFCFIFALQGAYNDRDLEQGEKRVFKAVLGIDDMKALKEFEQAPQKFWRQREQALLRGPEKALTHDEFCKRFVAEAKEFITKKALCEEGGCLAGFQSIDEMIAQVEPVDGCKRSSVSALYYATLCDKFVITGRFFLKENLSAGIEKVRAQLALLRQPFVDKMRWLIVDGGRFSILDSLIMLSHGFYLGAVALTPEERCAFAAHGAQYTRWEGVVRCGFIAHALNQFLVSFVLQKRWGVSAQNVFDSCCSADALAAGNMMTMCQQILGWFDMFCESSSYRGAYHPGCLFSLLFPHTNGSATIDSHFRDMVAHFMYIPEEYNWLNTPLRKYRCDDGVARRVVAGWSNLYCLGVLDFLPQRLFLQYLERVAHFGVDLPQSDLSRSPKFMPKLLDLCYKSKRRHKYQRSERDAEKFRLEARAQAKELVDALNTIARKDEKSFVALRLPYAVWAIVSTEYADTLRKNAHRVRLFCRLDYVDSVSYLVRKKGCRYAWRDGYRGSFDVFRGADFINAKRIALAFCSRLSDAVPAVYQDLVSYGLKEEGASEDVAVLLDEMTLPPSLIDYLKQK